jgi:hypothetical protein
MIVRLVARTLGAAAFAYLAIAGSAHAQANAPQPSAAAVALAVQILEVKGAYAAFDPVVDGVIRFTKGTFLQINPNLSRDLDAVAAQVTQESAGKRQEARTEVARAYASQFTEQELKDALAFYKSPLGKKIIDGEPKAFDEINKRMEAWSEKFAAEVNTKMRAEMRKKGHTAF